MPYQVGDEIGAMAAVLDFAPDGQIMTGGMVHDAWMVPTICSRTFGHGD